MPFPTIRTCRFLLRRPGWRTDLMRGLFFSRVWSIEDSKEKGKNGLCILAAAKKKPFLADPKFLKYKDFTVCDEADNGIQLWYLPFGNETERPGFRECAKHPHIEENGYVLYYTSQCPFNGQVSCWGREKNWRSPSKCLMLPPWHFRRIWNDSD